MATLESRLRSLTTAIAGELKARVKTVNGVAPNAAGNVTVSGGGSGNGESFGVIFPETHGVLSTNTHAQNSTAWDAIAQLSHDNGWAVHLNQWYTGTFSATNLHVELVGCGGGFEAPANGLPPINISHTLGTSYPITISQVQIGARTTKPSGRGNSTETVHALVGVPPANLRDFKPDDVVLVGSSDRYTWDTAFPEGNVYKAESIEVTGVSFIFTPGAGTVKEQDTIYGVTSGANAIVGAVAPIEGSTNLRIIVKTITHGNSGANPFGTESIKIGAAGTAVGTIGNAGSVLLKHRLADTYTTAPYVQRIPLWKATLSDIKVRTVGDPDGLVGTANRASGMIRLVNVVNPVVKDFEVHSSWASGVFPVNVYGGMIRGNIHGKGNNANNNLTSNTQSNQLSEQQYTYGVECYGACRNIDIDITARNIRHGFTTNPRGNGSGAFNEANTWSYGTPRDLTISGLAIDCWGSGFDNHEGAENLHYKDCINRYTAGGYRYLSGGPGFNNRSQNTTYENCYDYGSVVGFYDATGGDPLSQLSIIKFLNCHAIDFQNKGFSFPNASASANHRIVMENVFARGDGMTDQVGGGVYNQMAYEFAGVNMDIKGIHMERFNSWGIRMVTQHTTFAATINMKGLSADFSENPTNDAVWIEFGSGTGASAKLNLYSTPEYKEKAGQATLPLGVIKTNGTPIIRTPGGNKVINITGTRALPMFVAGATGTFSTVTGSEVAAGGSFTETYLTAPAGSRFDIYRAGDGTGAWPATRPAAAAGVSFRLVGIVGSGDPAWMLDRDSRAVTTVAVPGT